MSGPRNSDSVIGSKTPLENKFVNLENKNSDELQQKPIKIDINSPTYTESLIQDSTTVASVNTNIVGKKEKLLKQQIILKQETSERGIG